MTKDFIVLGGGNSGYISALILKSRFPETKVGIVESERMGIIGVGEGSTEHWSNFLKVCDIDPIDMIRYCGATYKLAIHYKNWKKTDYFHMVSETYSEPYDDYSCIYAKLISENKDPKELLDSWFLESRFPKVSVDSGLILSNQFHFDTNKLNEYLRKTCIRKGIEINRDDIIDIKINEESGNIVSLKSKDKEYHSNFFIDCSGFRSEIMKKRLGVKWVSYDKYFLMNSALAFQTEGEDIIDCYTTAEARDYGWTWKIPTQTRTGNGYVYSDLFATEEMIRDEIQKNYGDVDITKKVKFNPGRLETFWYKNCISVGLASNFIEPLEATSLTSVIQQMFCFTATYPSKDIDRFNSSVKNIFDDIVDYVLMHYICDRNDTPFWKYCKNNLVLTESLRDKIESWKNRLPQRNEFGPIPWRMFKCSNYIMAMYGLGLFNTAKIGEEYDIMMGSGRKKILDDNLRQIKNYENNVETVSHREALLKHTFF
tara:strand:+ start:4431 stop:5882 length:1452 start_codon:yes stop_codon:yes gene_type:complete